MRFISDDANDLKPAWLSSQETECPEKLLPGFWKLYTIADCRFFLWQMLSASLSSENQDVDASPGEQISFFENLVVYLEAAFILHDQSTSSNSELGEAGDSIRGAHLKNVKGQEILTRAGNRHRKLNKRLKRLSIWNRDGFDNPYVMLDSFFDAYDMASFKVRLYDILQVCCQEKYYDKGSPADVLYFLEKVESIINAGYLILMTERDKRGDNLKPAMESIGDESTISKSSEIELPEVSVQFLAEFFENKSLKKWKQELNRICLYSLSSQSAQQWGVWIDPLTVYKQISSLVETAFDLRKIKSELG